MAPTAFATPTPEARSLWQHDKNSKGSSDPRAFLWVGVGVLLGCLLLLVWGAARSWKSVCKRIALYKHLMYSLRKAPSDSVGLCRRGCMRCELQMARWHALQGAARTAGVDADSYAASLSSPKQEPQSLQGAFSTSTLVLPTPPPEARSPFYI